MKYSVSYRVPVEFAVFATSIYRLNTIGYSEVGVFVTSLAGAICLFDFVALLAEVCE